MPELPEVENVRRGLEKILEDHPVIRGFEFHRPDLRDPIPVDQLNQLTGSAITAVRRRGKYLILETAKGSILSHLGMTGSWRLALDTDLRRTHDHVAILLKSGESLVYHDPRRFGILDSLIGEWSLHPRLKHLGPEPLEADFHADYLQPLLRARSTPVKTVLMDASIVVGVGNIYASEALFRAGVRPGRRAQKVTKAETQKIVEAIQEVLAEAIAAGGSSISDYVQANGEQGSFQQRFRVYDRTDEPCRVCATPIRWQVHAGRSTYFCPKCQR